MTQMNATAIVTITFHDGSMKQYPGAVMHVDKCGSLLLLTIDGRTYGYVNVSIIDISLANTEDREMVA